MRHEEILGLLPRLRYAANCHPGFWLFLLELLFWAIVAGATYLLVRSKPGFLERCEARLSAVATHRTFWLVAFPVLVIAIRCALLPWIPRPIPIVHDEFSYLLGADTFAQGCLTNPPSPMWVHFESFHINVRPTYQSMYPPGQALMLALGQVLTGVPWAGVVLSVALMASAIYWMLLGWLPAPWAWLGGAFAVARFSIFSYWINSYWGGAVAAIGGALVLGALPRLRGETRLASALAFAAGLLILANSRPLEGFLFSLPLVLAALWTLFVVRRHAWRQTAVRLLPALALLVAGFAGMLYYNKCGTGHALVMPYTVNYQTYHISKPFMFQTANPIPRYRHQVMRAFYVYHEIVDVLHLRYDGPWEFIKVRLTIYYAFFLWPFLLLLAPAILTLWQTEVRVVLFSVLLVALDLTAQIWPPHAHYAGPACGAVILLVLLSLQHLRTSHPNHGAWASRAAVMVMAFWLLSPIADKLLRPFGILPITAHQFDKDKDIQNSVHKPIPWLPLEVQRERIEADLEARSGKHLVIVHHPYHDVPSMDWVYNRADIDHAKVIWARDMGYLNNQELLEYYPDRQVWYVDRGDPTAAIRPYSAAILPWKLALDHRAEDSLYPSPGRQEVKRSLPEHAHSASLVAKSAALRRVSRNP